MSHTLTPYTYLEIATQHRALLENEIQELTIQLRPARENIFKLVDMHAHASAERDCLKVDLQKAKDELITASR